MKMYDFTVGMCGYGETPEEAWQQAVDHMLSDLKYFASAENVPDFEAFMEDE